jgi:hypothetical protein
MAGWNWRRKIFVYLRVLESGAILKRILLFESELLCGPKNKEQSWLWDPGEALPQCQGRRQTQEGSWRGGRSGVNTLRVHTRPRGVGNLGSDGHGGHWPYPLVRRELQCQRITVETKRVLLLGGTWSSESVSNRSCDFLSFLFLPQSG